MGLLDNIKVIFFDLDNTLWDFEKNSKLTLEELYEEKLKALDKNGFGCSRFIDIFENINEGLWADYRFGRVTRAELRKLRFYRALKELGTDNEAFGEAIEKEYVSRTALKPYLVDGAVDVLNYLHGRYILGVITNGFIEAQEVKLENSGIGRYFDYITVSENAGYNKPDRRIFDYALRGAGVSPSEALFIGDEYEVDIQGSFNAGIRSIWFNRKHIANTRSFECVEIFSLSELLSIL